MRLFKAQFNGRDSYIVAESAGDALAAWSKTTGIKERPDSFALVDEKLIWADGAEVLSSRPPSITPTQHGPGIVSTP